MHSQFSVLLWNVFCFQAENNLVVHLLFFEGRHSIRKPLWAALHSCVKSAENTVWVCQLLNIYGDSNVERQHRLWRVVPRATVALSCCQLVLVINETPSQAWLSWQRNASLRPTFQLLTWAIYLAITRLRFECKLVW